MMSTEQSASTPAPRKSGCLGKLIIFFALVAGVAFFGFRDFTLDLIKDVTNDYSKDSSVVNNLDKAVDQVTFQKILDYLNTNVPEIKQQQNLFHQKKNTGIKLIENLQGLELPPPLAPDYALVRDYHWVYVNFWFHRGLFDDKQLWSWTFLVKRDFSEVLAYDSEKDTFLRIPEWRNDMGRVRQYMALADK